MLDFLMSAGCDRCVNWIDSKTELVVCILYIWLHQGSRSAAQYSCAAAVLIRLTDGEEEKTFDMV